MSKAPRDDWQEEGVAKRAGLPAGANTRFPSASRQCRPLNYAHTPRSATHPAFNTPRTHGTRDGPTEPVTHQRPRSRNTDRQPHLAVRVMTLEAIRYRSGSLQILNQLLLPRETVYDEIRSVRDGYEAIKSMKVTLQQRARPTASLPGSVRVWAPGWRSFVSDRSSGSRFVRAGACVICITCAWSKVTENMCLCWRKLPDYIVGIVSLTLLINPSWPLIYRNNDDDDDDHLKLGWRIVRIRTRSLYLCI